MKHFIGKQYQRRRGALRGEWMIRSMKNKYRDLLKDTFIFTLSNLGSKLILFFLVPLYTAYMSREEYGTADLVFTVAQLVLPVVTLVIYDAIVRFGLSKNENAENVLLAAVVVIAAGAAFTLLACPLLNLYPAIRPWKWQLALYIILSAFYSANMNYLKVKNVNLWYALISIVHTALMATLNVLWLAVFRLGVRGYLRANIVSLGAALLLSFFIGKIPAALKKARLDRRLLREMAAFSVPLILNNISWWVVHSSDKLMLEAMLGAAALGLYTAAAKIPAFINVIINIFSQAWGISSVKEYENTNDTGFYSSVLRINVFICFGACVLLVALTKPFMKLYVSEEFYEAWRYVPVLLAAAAFASIAYYYGSLYGALKKSGNNMATTLLAAIVNIAVNYFGIKLVGIHGASIGTLVAYLVMAHVRLYDVGRFLPIRIDWGWYLPMCALVLVQAAMVTLDWYGAWVSCGAILLFALLNRELMKEALGKAAAMLKKHRGNSES